MKQETTKYSVRSVIIVKKSEQPDQLNTEISFNSLQVAQPTHWRLISAISQTLKMLNLTWGCPASRSDRAAEGICENTVCKISLFLLSHETKMMKYFFDKKNCPKKLHCKLTYTSRMALRSNKLYTQKIAGEYFGNILDIYMLHCFTIIM